MIEKGEIVMTALKTTKKTLQVIAFAAEYHKHITPITHHLSNGGDVCFYANNFVIADYLKKDFTIESFTKLFDLCKQKGVFDLHFCNHIPSVTFNAAAKHMTRKWPRDHMGMMPLIEDKYSDELWLGLLEWAKAYNSPKEIKAFELIFKDPKKACFNEGISHTFWQGKEGNLSRDNSWKMHQRIESHGELLRYMAKNSLKRILNHLALPQDIITAIVYFTHYLYVQGLSPQSCGAWEEIPFKNGINWDDASVILAFSEVVSLINELKKQPQIYKKFLNAEKKITQKFKLALLFAMPDNLSTFIKESLKLIRHFYLDEFRGSSKRIDSSCVMLCAEKIDLSCNHNLQTNIAKHLRMLQHWERKLVHEFGAWRYNNFFTKVDNRDICSCDSYLNLNYYLLCDNNGHLCLNKVDFDKGDNAKKSDNGVNHFKLRGKNMAEKTSAQWGLPLSYAAIAFGRLTSLLLDVKEQKGSLSMKEKALLKQCVNKNQEYIKRTYANISGCFSDGSLFLKADGNQIKPFCKPEAYQAVTSKLNTKQFAFIPGVNDHLGWDAAKCYEASKLFLDNLRRLKKLKI